MSACYEISGVVRVRRSPALDAILAGLRSYFRPGLVLAVESEEREPGILTVSLDAVGVFTRGAGVPELDEMVRSLGPHAVEPAVFLTTYEHRQASWSWRLPSTPRGLLSAGTAGSRSSRCREI
jgi:hypothetical protein